MPLGIPSDRLGKIWWGYTVSAIAAGLAITAVMATLIAFAPNGLPNSGFAETVGRAMAIAALIAVFAIPFTFLLAMPPAIAAILYAEPRGIRSPTGYAAMGVLVSAIAFGGLAAFFAWTSGRASVSSPAAPATGTAVQFAIIAALVVVPGLCGGLTYWAKTGRYAGGTTTPSPGSATASA